jgi:L-amino acid N-acyltransferase YncA
MHIRHVEPRDAASTASLLNAIIATGVETSMFEPLSLADQQRYIASFPARGVFLVAELEAGGPIIGMQSVEPHGTAADANGHIAEISTFVAAAHRGAGVGAVLMRRLCDEARSRGLRKLVATIRADNASAQRFYERSGFRIVGLLEGHSRQGERFIDQVLAERLLVTGNTSP